jgi:regulator of replication initiation timing
MKTQTFKSFKILLFLLGTTLMTACSIDADNVVTETDKLKNELEEVIEENDITDVSVFLLKTHSQGDVYYYKRHEKESFTLEEQFIRVDELYYNLEKLAKYEVDGYNPKYLKMYFDIY